MSEPSRPRPTVIATLAALTVASGFLDAVSYIGLGHVFTANMTGNVVFVGFSAARAPGFSFTASLTALAAFAAGAVAAGHLVRQLQPQRNLLLVVMLMEGVLTAAAAVIATVVPNIAVG